TAYRHIVADEPDVILHLGDYIYEATWGRDLVRSHGAGEAVTLEDYRRRYALYKTDADLQAGHAICPWLITWDDHEVENDYANDRSQFLDAPEWFLARRAAAYKAWYEHMPVPRQMLPFGPNAPRLHAGTDDWDAYPAARRRLLESLAGKSNPIVIGGDIHCFNVNQLKLDFDDPASPVVAAELVGTSITSQAWPQERIDALRGDNPHLLFADSRYRGYVRVDVTPQRLHADLRGLDTVQIRDGKCSTIASFVVEDGHPGIRGQSNN